MIITPQARRLISGAVLLLADEARSRWNEWDRQFSLTDAAADAPREIADIALRALEAAERDLEWRLQQSQLHEDVRSDMLNDLASIRAIGASIKGVRASG